MNPREVIIPIGPSIAYVPLTREKYSLIDKEDAPYLGGNKWYAGPSGRNRSLYAVRQKWTGGSYSLVSIHRQLMGFPSKGICVDHINCNGLDNRRCNLRLATHAQNRRNSPRQSNNSSGFKGVWRQSDCDRWAAAIWVDKKRYYLGLFLTPEEAHAAYCEAANTLHGEFARVA